jgi:hypothetical protein
LLSLQKIHEYSTTFIRQIVRSENPRNPASSSPVLRRVLEKKHRLVFSYICARAHHGVPWTLGRVLNGGVPHRHRQAGIKFMAHARANGRLIDHFKVTVTSVYFLLISCPVQIRSRKSELLFIPLSSLPHPLTPPPPNHPPFTPVSVFGISLLNPYPSAY